MTPDERERRARERKERTEAEFNETLDRMKRDVASIGTPRPTVEPTIKLDTSGIGTAVPESLRTLHIDPAPNDDKAPGEAPPPAIDRMAVAKGAWSSLNREEQADFIRWAEQEDWKAYLDKYGWPPCIPKDLKEARLNKEQDKIIEMLLKHFKDRRSQRI
jgi:hypothetical protein